MHCIRIFYLNRNPYYNLDGKTIVDDSAVEKGNTMEKKLVLKICAGEWINASRDERELSVYRELGADTVVLAKGGPNDRLKEDEVDGFRVLRLTTRPMSNLPIALNRIMSVFLWAEYVKKLQPDVISGRNLGGLAIGWLSTLTTTSKPLLIYDAHEFEIGRLPESKRFKRWCVKRLEGFLIRRCAFSIMVNDFIADEVIATYKLKDRPIVIRNVPNLWNVDGDVCNQKRKEFLDSFHNGNVRFILIHHGALLTTRGIEMIIKTAAKLNDVGLVILGNGNPDYVHELGKLAEKLGIIDRIYFHNAVPIDELWKYVGAADAGIIAAPALIKNNLYSLPNKFFENIQSETPIICPNYPAMGKIIEQYGIGATCDPQNLEEMTAAVKQLKDNIAFYKECKDNLYIAKQKMCWEKEKLALVDAAKKILNE